MTRAPLVVLLLVAAGLAGCAERPAAPAREAALARPPWPALPVDLHGLSRDDVELLLGPPDFLRRERPAVYMQYRLGPCTVDLFLYADPKSGEHHVVHHELRDLGHAGGPGPCRARLLPLGDEARQEAVLPTRGSH